MMDKTYQHKTKIERDNIDGVTASSQGAQKKMRQRIRRMLPKQLQRLYSKTKKNSMNQPLLRDIQEIATERQIPLESQNTGQQTKSTEKKTQGPAQRGAFPDIKVDIQEGPNTVSTEESADWTTQLESHKSNYESQLESNIAESVALKEALGTNPTVTTDLDSKLGDRMILVKDYESYLDKTIIDLEGKKDTDPLAQAALEAFQEEKIKIATSHVPLRRWSMRRELHSVEAQIAQIEAAPETSNKAEEEQRKTKHKALNTQKEELATSITSSMTKFNQFDGDWKSKPYGSGNYGDMRQKPVYDKEGNEKKDKHGKTKTRQAWEKKSHTDFSRDNAARSGADLTQYTNKLPKGDTKDGAMGKMMNELSSLFPGMMGEKITFDQVKGELLRGNVVIFKKLDPAHIEVIQSVSPDGQHYFGANPGSSDKQSSYTAEEFKNMGYFYVVKPATKASTQAT